MFFLWLRQIAKYNGYKDKRNKEKQHDIYAGNNAEFFQDGASGKRKNAKTDASRNVAKQGDNAHAPDHFDDSGSFIPFLLERSMKFVQEINAIRYADNDQ